MTSKSIFKILIFIVLNYSSAFAIEIADFMANEEGYPGYYRQGYVVAAFDANGNYVVAWRDFRSSPAKGQAQVYGAVGSPLGPNFKIYDDLAGAGDSRQLSIASNGNDRAVAVWTRRRQYIGPDL